MLEHFMDRMYGGPGSRVFIQVRPDYGGEECLFCGMLAMICVIDRAVITGYRRLLPFIGRGQTGAEALDDLERKLCEHICSMEEGDDSA